MYIRLVISMMYIAELERDFISDVFHLLTLFLDTRWLTHSLCRCLHVRTRRKKKDFVWYFVFSWNRAANRPESMLHELRPHTREAKCFRDRNCRRHQRKKNVLLIKMTSNSFVRQRTGLADLCKWVDRCNGAIKKATNGPCWWKIKKVTIEKIRCSIFLAKLSQLSRRH